MGATAGEIKAIYEREKAKIGENPIRYVSPAIYDIVNPVAPGIFTKSDVKMGKK